MNDKPTTYLTQKLYSWLIDTHFLVSLCSFGKIYGMLR